MVVGYLFIFLFSFRDETRLFFSKARRGFSADSFAGGGAAKVQVGEERPDESEAHADGEEGTEHAEGNIAGQQRDTSAEEPAAFRGSLQSFKRQNRLRGEAVFGRKRGERSTGATATALPGITGRSIMPPRL